MSGPKEPRLAERSSSASDELRHLLASADQDSPSVEQLAQLETRLAALLRPPSVPDIPRTATKAAGSVGKAKALIAVVTVGTAALTGLRITGHGLGSPEVGVQTIGVESDPTQNATTPYAATMTHTATTPHTATMTHTATIAHNTATPHTATSAHAALPGPAPSHAPSKNLPMTVSTGELPHRVAVGNELELLGTAQTALARREPTRALRLVAEHQKAFPSGLYREEFERIAIEALVQAGRNQEAKARAQQFFTRYPHSAHRARIEQWVGQSGEL